jgi:hypothetical protein
LHASPPAYLLFNLIRLADYECKQSRKKLSLFEKLEGNACFKIVYKKLTASASLCFNKLKIFRYDGDEVSPVSTRNKEKSQQ